MRQIESCLVVLNAAQKISIFQANKFCGIRIPSWTSSVIPKKFRPRFCAIPSKKQSVNIHVLESMSKTHHLFSIQNPRCFEWFPESFSDETSGESSGRGVWFTFVSPPLRWGSRFTIPKWPIKICLLVFDFKHKSSKGFSFIHFATNFCVKIQFKFERWMLRQISQHFKVKNHKKPFETT